MKKILFILGVTNLYFTISNHLKLKTIMDDQKQAAADLQAVSAQLKKIGGESSTLLEKITALENAANNSNNLDPELRSAIDDVKTQAKVVDDLVPDPTDTSGGAGDNSGGPGAV